MIATVRSHKGPIFEIPLSKDGRLNFSTTVFAPNSVLAFQLANGESGAINELPSEIPKDLLIAVDATAAGARLKLPDRWDSACFDSRSWDGPAGLAIVAINNAAQWKNPLPHISSIRRTYGTYSLPLLLASAVALENYRPSEASTRELTARFRTDISKALPDALIAGELEKILTIATTVGVIALLAPGLIVYNNYINTPKNALQIEVNAWQWGWQYRLPGEDGILGTAHVAKISDDNPFGINLDDPNGKDDILIQDDVLHLKTDRPVKILLRSLDVLHNYYVPQFRAKMDAIPGIISYYWFEPNKIGEYEVLCAEYCGVGHYAMRAKVVVESEDNYENWIKEQETFSDLIAKQENDKLKTTLIVKNNN